MATINDLSRTAEKCKAIEELVSKHISSFESNTETIYSMFNAARFVVSYKEILERYK
jgi:hypothetical protein